MCEAYSVLCMKSLWHAGAGHDALAVITFPVGSYLAYSMTAHISCPEGDCFVAIFSNTQSTWG